MNSTKEILLQFNIQNDDRQHITTTIWKFILTDNKYNKFVIKHWKSIPEISYNNVVNYPLSL